MIRAILEKGGALVRNTKTATIAPTPLKCQFLHSSQCNNLGQHDSTHEDVETGHAPAGFPWSCCSSGHQGPSKAEASCQNDLVANKLLQLWAACSEEIHQQVYNSGLNTPPMNWIRLWVGARAQGGWLAPRLLWMTWGHSSRSSGWSQVSPPMFCTLIMAFHFQLKILFIFHFIIIYAFP